VRETFRMQGTHDPIRVEPLDAAALCRHLVPNVRSMLLADHRRELFPDELFADLFPSGRGRPSVPADVVATVMVLQVHEGLSDREAATQLRQNIAWKVACRLALTDPGFHPQRAHLVAYQAARLQPTRADLRGGPGSGAGHRGA
jgi:hypothetical protein